jgi:hypothetical protein
MKLEPGAYDEIVRRIVRLRELAAELAEAYDDPVAKKGAGDIRESLERVLQLLGYAGETFAVSYEPAAKRPVRVAVLWRGFGGTGRFPQGK